MSFTSVYAGNFKLLHPHRAIYDISLVKAETRSGIKDIDGRIVYQLNGSQCEGISLQFRFVANIQTAREEYITDQRTATYESGDGEEFSFQTNSYVNEVADQLVSGFANQEEESIKLSLTGKTPKKLELEKAIFPSSHITDILEAASEGKTFLNHMIFDGSGEGDEVFKTSTVIGKPKLFDEIQVKEGAEIYNKILNKKAWPINISYFETKFDNSSEGLPVYEVSMIIHEDGVTREMTMRYPDYTLKAALKAIEYFKKDGCE